MQERKIRVPRLASVEMAVTMYYERVDLSNADIKQLFGGTGDSTIAKLKKAANEQRRIDGRYSWNPSRVDTVSAYKAWGLDIGDLERRLAVLKRMEGRRAAKAREEAV